MAIPTNFIYGLLEKAKDASSSVFSTAYNGSKWMIGGAINGSKWVVIGLPSSALNGIVSFANNTLQSQTFQSTKTNAQNALETVRSKKNQATKAFLNAPPAEIKELNQQLSILSQTPDNITHEDIETLGSRILFLSKDDNKLLKELAPHLPSEDLAACTSFFPLIKGIIENEKFVIDNENPANEELEAELLEPLRQGEGKNQLIAFASVINKITANHNGFIIQAADSFNGHKGMVAGALTFAGVYYFTGSPFFAATTSLALGTAAANPSLVAQPTLLAEKGKVILFGSPLVADARSKMNELDRAITKNKPHKEIVKSAKSLKSLLKQLSQDQKIIFTPALNRKELQHLKKFWEALRQIDENNPDSINTLEGSLKKALLVVENRYRTQKGLLEAAADSMRGVITGAKNDAEDLLEEVKTAATDVIEEPLARAETIVQTNVYNALGWELPARAPRNTTAAQVGPGAQVPPPAAPVNSDPANASEEGSISQFLEWAASNLKGLIGEKYAGILSKKTLPAATGFIALILNQVLGTLNDSDSHRFAKTKLTEIVTALNSAAENNDWQKLLPLLKNAADALSGVKIYVGNFRVPIPGTGANLESEQTTEAALSENIAALNEAIATPEPEPENQNWKELAIEEKDRLVSNATSFLTMKHIYEEVCGLQPLNEKFYPEILRAATDTVVTADGRTKKVLSEERLKALFFEELNAKKVGFLKKVFAEMHYWLYGKGVKYFTKKVTTIYFKEVFSFIGNHNKDSFNFVRSMIINNFTRYLTILGGAYKTVANTPSATGLMSEMLMTELEKKEANLGFETNELYLDFAKIVLEKAGGSTFGWIISKFLGNPEEIIRSVIDMSTGSMQDTNGYTHAINTVIGDQLDEVWKLLQGSQSSSETTSNDASTEISEGQKNQLSILVNNLFEILRKSKCSTVDELRNLMEGKLLSENVNQAIDGLFIQDIIEQTTRILASTIESLIQEKHLEKLTYTFANLINNTFEVAEEVTPRQMQDAEEKVGKRSEQILRFAVDAAIKDQLDFSGKKQQNETNGFIDQLHQLSNTYFDGSTSENITIDGAIQNLEKLANMDIESPSAKNKIDEIIEKALAYEESCKDLNLQVKAATISSDNKDEINKRILSLTQESKPFIEAVGQLKIHSRSLSELQTAIPRLNQIRISVGEIGRKLYQTAYASLEDIEFAESQVMAMASLITELKTLGNLTDVIPLFTYQQERLEKIIVNQREAHSARSLYSELSQPDSLFEQIVGERKQQLQHPFPQAANQENLERMKQKLMVVRSDSLRPQLIEQVKAIENAIFHSQVETAQTQFMQLLTLAVNEANQKILPGRDQHWDCYQKVDGIIRNTHLLEPQKTQAAKQAIQEAIMSSKQRLHALKSWENENYNQITYSNFSWSATKWMQDGVSEMGAKIVYGRVRERLDGVLNLLKREETYRYGILHHSLLIPYVQRIQKQKK